MAPVLALADLGTVVVVAFTGFVVDVTVTADANVNDVDNVTPKAAFADVVETIPVVAVAVVFETTLSF